MRFLEECQCHGQVMIVTNAETGWVELSAKRFIPRVLDALEKHGIEVLSARSTYEPEYPGSPFDWKAQAFLERVSSKYGSEEAMEHMNLISVGDSVSERDAAHFVGGRTQTEAKVKTVKFVERPDIEQLRRQLMLLTNNLGEICQHPGSFDVNLMC